MVLKHGSIFELPSPEKLSASFENSEVARFANSLQLIGVNHHSAELAIRERVAISSSELGECYFKLRELGASEAILVSTCNRTEIYCEAPSAKPLRDFLNWRSDFYEFSEGQVFERSGINALTHLFQVACGLQSQVLGENEILGQLKRAFGTAKVQGVKSSVLFQAFEQALSLGKRVRSDTEINAGSISIATLAVTQASKLRSLKKVAVLGTGEVGTTVARELLKYSNDITVVSHTERYAQRLADEVNATVASIADLKELMPELDALFCATEAPHPVIDSSFVKLCSPKDSNCSCKSNNSVSCAAESGALLFDLGMPRNISPDLAGNPAVTLFDLDALRANAEEALSQRKSSIPLALNLLKRELWKIDEKLRAKRSVPLIKAIDSQRSEIMNSEVDWLLERLELDQEGEELVRLFAHRMLSRAFHPQIDMVKQLSKEDDSLALLNKIVEETQRRTRQ